MTASTRPAAALRPTKAVTTANATHPSAIAAEHWHRAVAIRREWLAYGLSTEPADRTLAEQSLENLYARLGRPRPDIVWVDSPRQSISLTAGFPTHDTLHQWVYGPRPAGVPPLASDLAAALSRLRSTLDDCVTAPGFDPPPPRKRREDPWPTLPPQDAMSAGIPFREVLRQGVREPLQTTLAGLYLPVRAALGSPAIAWYGQQEAYWIAYYDVWRRLDLARYARADNDHLDDWAALARSSGWWWPGENVCVVAERPAVINTEPVPGALHEQRRLNRAGRPAVEFRDGWRPR